MFNVINMDRNRCDQVVLELKKLKTLRIEFEVFYERGVVSKDFTRLEYVKKQIKNLLEDSSSALGNLHETLVAPGLNSLKLKKQYDQQVKVALESGLFESEPVIERDGQRYPMPSWVQVQRILKRNRKILKAKSAQGFTRMLIVPFGYDLQVMAEKLYAKIVELQEGGGIFDATGNKINIDLENEPSYMEGTTLLDDFFTDYYSGDYAGITDSHTNAFTKDEVITSDGVWQICFVEDMPVIPLDSDVEGNVIGGRRRLDRVGTWIESKHKKDRVPAVNEFNKFLAGNKEGVIAPGAYNNEGVMPSEHYFWMQFSSLLGDDKPVLMDYENGEKRGTYLLGGYNTVDRGIVVFEWNKEKRQIEISCASPESSDPYLGVRTAVVLGNSPG